jgi:hypothetical protein
MILTQAHEGIVGGHYAGKEMTHKKKKSHGSGKKHYKNMPKSIVNHVMYVKEWEIHPEEMAFL